MSLGHLTTTLYLIFYIHPCTWRIVGFVAIRHPYHQPLLEKAPVELRCRDLLGTSTCRCTMQHKLHQLDSMAQQLTVIFGGLGISQYLDAFVEQGFDTWETILDITESDLDVLGVKLGHRRKLQRRIANYRGLAPEASLAPLAQPSIEDFRPTEVVPRAEPPKMELREPGTVIVTKRKYRRHPKADENAPERPPSAYVLFSNSKSPIGKRLSRVRKATNPLTPFKRCARTSRAVISHSPRLPS